MLAFIDAGLDSAETVAKTLAAGGSAQRPAGVIDARSLLAIHPALHGRALVEHACAALEALVDARERRGVRTHAILIPGELTPAAGELAFWLRGRIDQRCVLVSRERAWSLPAERIVELVRAGEPSIDLPVWAPAPPRILTPRLILTVPKPEQSRDYFRRIHGTDIFEQLLWEGPAAPDEPPHVILAWAKDWARGPGHPMGLGVIRRVDQVQIGGVGVKAKPGDPACGTLGYALDPAEHRKGYATEAVAAVVEFCFRERGFMRIAAEVFVGNEPSRKLLERAGFSLEGTSPSHDPKRGSRRDTWLFGLTRGAWQERHSAAGTSASPGIAKASRGGGHLSQAGSTP